MKTILAVDDTSINLDILLEYLKDYNLIITTSGYQALEILKENRVDLILLDIVMPNIDGFETCIKIKSNPLTKEIPIIFITAKKDEQSIEKAYDIGGVDYVTKPFMKKELLSRINTHLKLYEQNQFLMKKIEQETQKRVEQQKLFEKQSKLAAMGEMVDAIAHQWKQPLSIINILSSNLELKSNYMECVTKEIIEQTNNDIIEQVEHLTQTINEFRNFFKADIQLKNTNIKELISSVIKLNESMLVENEIEVIVNCKDDIFYNLNQNEFKHIFINIINNS
ncbi:MAG: response regulator, partial [Campylobacterota bacterium]|nr:response regulator [Campylobacterota bacterium]